MKDSKSQKHVVIIIARLGIGGAERLVIDDAAEFSQRGWKVSIVTLRDELAHSFDSVLTSGGTIQQMTFNTLFDVSGWVELVRFLGREQPDLILTHLWYANTIGRIASWLCGTRNQTLAFEHNIYDDVKTRGQFIADWMLQNCCRKIIAVSSAIKDSLIRNAIQEKNITVIPNAIDMKRFEIVSDSRIRDELNLHDAFIYLYVGRLVHQKAVDILIDAFAQVSDGVLLIAGQGEDRHILEKQAEQRGVSSRVYFLGVRSDIPELMKAAGCVILVSRREGHPIVCLEAMAAGSPIIVSDFPTGLDIFHDHVNALVVPRENSVALAQAMEEMFTDSHCRDSLRLQGISDMQRFSIHSHVDSILACLQ